MDQGQLSSSGSPGALPVERGRSAGSSAVTRPSCLLGEPQGRRGLDSRPPLDAQVTLVTVLQREVLCGCCQRRKRLLRQSGQEGSHSGREGTGLHCQSVAAWELQRDHIAQGTHRMLFVPWVATCQGTSVTSFNLHL